MKGSVVGACHQDVVLIHCNRVQYGRVLRYCAQLLTLRTLPNADLVSTSGCKSVLPRVIDQGAHSFLVMSERVKAVALAYVPQADHLVVRT